MKEKLLSYTKKLILFVLICSEIQIFASYILAFLGMPEIAQELSSTVVTVCLGSIGFYCIKSLIENLSKYGGLFAKVDYEPNGLQLTDEDMVDKEEDGFTNLEDYRD